MIELPGFLLFTLIVMRMSGFVLLNPIFGRRNIPAFIKGGFILVLSISVFGVAQADYGNVDILNSFDYGFLLIKEFCLGYVIGFVINLFFYIGSYAGAMIDFHMGMSMANIYDPQTNASMPLSGTLFNAMVLMIFFAVNGHLALLKIFLRSQDIIPFAQMTFTSQTLAAILDIFKECTVLAVKLSLPILAMELLGEVGVGILMKVIPQINVFIVNIQVKVFVGFYLMLVLCVPIGAFFGDVIDMMIRSIGQIMTLM